jgi:hypothetical protein
MRWKSRSPAPQNRGLAATWADQGGTVGPRQGKRVEPAIRLFADQNFNERILKGLARLQPAIDVLHVRDIGLQASADSVILERAASDGRILLTHDRQTLPGFAYARVAAGAPMPGVFLVSKALPIGQAIDEILLAVQCLSPEECKDIVKYFPMWTTGRRTGIGTVLLSAVASRIPRLLEPLAHSRQVWNLVVASSNLVTPILNQQRLVASPRGLLFLI